MTRGFTLHSEKKWLNGFKGRQLLAQSSSTTNSSRVSSFRILSRALLMLESCMSGKAMQRGNARRWQGDECEESQLGEEGNQTQRT
uniref:Uncharacterized protein n=1 Tax=Nelumbo nucifera TaxID=4432 RepID=A0A822YK97_NELNU|nr:TPA_asm: hypothetical protein HUJ06_011871 [Nelumbo nucifera]